MIIFAESLAITENTQFWAVVLIFAALLADMIRRDFQRRQDKKAESDAAALREAERKLEKQERLEAEKRVKLEREEIAAKIKAEQRETEEKVKKELERNAEIIRQELQIHYDREMLELQKSAFAVIRKVGEQEQVVKTLDGKIVTLTVADEHKNELKDAIKESTEKAGAAFEVANTINEKLEKMSAAGLLNQEQEAGRIGIDKVEAEKGESE